MTGDLLRVRDLVVRYRGSGRHGDIRAVNGVDLTVRRGTTVGLVGESGSGKSSIGMSILGLVEPESGTIEFDGADITRVTRAARRLLARRMQVIFQDPYGSMNPARTVGDALAEALRHNLGLGRAETGERIGRALDDVGLPAGAASRYPGEFSGGQRQRIAIARALVMDPEFIVCDEAVSALDLSVQAQVLNLLARLKEQRGLSYLFISHDLAVVRYFCEEIVVLYGGRVVERGPAAPVAGSPVHPYTRALLAAVPVPDPAAQRLRRATTGDEGSGQPQAGDQKRWRPGGRRGSGSTAGRGHGGQGCDCAPRCPFAADLCLTKRPELSIYGDGDVDVACHRSTEIAAMQGGDTPLIRRNLA